jgi:hypothetical protein
LSEKKIVVKKAAGTSSVIKVTSSNMPVEVQEIKPKK